MKTLATLSNWTPARAAGFSRRRLAKIELLLREAIRDALAERRSL